MAKAEVDSAFLKNKFDLQIKPWQIIVKFKNDFDPNTQNSISYNYSIKKDMKNDEVWEWEREPSRQLKI